MAKLFQNRFIKIVLGIFRGVFTAIIVVYLLFVLLQRINGNSSVFGYRLFTVASGSMSGVYEINDVIAVKDWNVDDLKIGDDIAFQGTRGGLEGKLITHRIIRIEEADDEKGRIFVTKGINAQSEDPATREDQILGKVVGIVPIITTLNHVVKTQLGFFLLIFCPLVLIIVLEVLQTVTDIRLEKKEIQRIGEESSEDDKADEEVSLEDRKELKKEDEKQESVSKNDDEDDIEIL